MTVQTMWHIACDQCGTAVAAAGEPLPDVLDLLRARGWRRHAANPDAVPRDICPTCRGARR